MRVGNEKYADIWDIMCFCAGRKMTVWVEGGWKSCPKDIFVKALATIFLFTLVFLKNY